MKFICDLSWDTKKMLERIYKQSKHHQTRQRAKCLLLSLKGTPIKELMKIFEVTRKTIYNWFSSWEENKLLGLYERAGRGRKPKLTKEQEKQVKEWVKEEPKNLALVSSS
jgi:transposase